LSQGQCSGEQESRQHAGILKSGKHGSKRPSGVVQPLVLEISFTSVMRICLSTALHMS
jgi:hypothetical protein